MDTTKFNKTENLLDDETLEGMIRFQRAKNLFLRDDSHDIEDAEIVYPSKMNEILDISTNQVKLASSQDIIDLTSNSPNNLSRDKEITPFIVANTIEVPLHHLKQDCIIPVFSKDNEKTIAHQEFIESVLTAISKVFPHHSISTPEIRVSHQIKGRTPDAIHLNAKDLLDHQKTIYYERMAFVINIPSIVDSINGNELTLSVGGVRSYNLENLYNRKTLEKFKFFIGFQNKVCLNMCINTDGFKEDLRVSSASELQHKVIEVMQNYNAELHLMEMKEFTQDYLSEHQFAQLIGKSRLYQHLPKSEKQKIPMLNFNDSHINTMAKDYYEDKNFCRLDDGRINLWDVYNLFTQANKSSYIDTFLDRNLNAFEFTKGIQKILSGNSDYHWFLS